jgi:hypothetical protein
MKIIKILSLCLGVAFIGLIGYANFRYKSPAEKLEKVQLASFKLTGNLTTEESVSLEKTVSGTLGVTACTLRENGNIASVIFIPKKITIEYLKELLSNNGKISVTQKQLATSGGCPVHKVNASLDRFIATLDLRNF